MKEILEALAIFTLCVYVCMGTLIGALVRLRREELPYLMTFLITVAMLNLVFSLVAGVVSNVAEWIELMTLIALASLIFGYWLTLLADRIISVKGG